jgi:hypothetical protein
MSNQRKQPRDRRAEAKAAAERAQEDARAAAARRRFDSKAMLGRPVEEAKSYYVEQGFPVKVESIGGAADLSWFPERVRLVIDADGLVARAYLG